MPETSRAEAAARRSAVRNAVLACAVIVAALWAYFATRPSPATGPLQVRLGDSVAFESDIDGGILRRVRVVAPDGTATTISGVLVDDLPVIVGDSLVYGLETDSTDGDAVGVFAYDLRTRQVYRLARPADWLLWQRPRLAPDGQHVAYLAQRPSDSGRGYLAVVTVPSMAIVYRAPAVALLETDTQVAFINWIGPQMVTATLLLAGEPEREQRVTLKFDPQTVTIDTVQIEKKYRFPRLSPR